MIDFKMITIANIVETMLLYTDESLFKVISKF